jgi:hypothetical protein
LDIIGVISKPIAETFLDTAVHFSSLSAFLIVRGLLFAIPCEPRELTKMNFRGYYAIKRRVAKSSRRKDKGPSFKVT